MSDVRDSDEDNTTSRKHLRVISISSDSDEFHISTPPRSSKKPPRVSKKRKQAAEQTRREAYANELFAELNRDIFDQGLPKETKLNWNKRLLTTAGRAKWHRSRDGVTTTEIELAMKILDCDERIRNTLSHEMCHLACWIINGQLKEGHGSIWKGWAAKVTGKRPDIEISSKHNYEISYPFEWKCEKCAKIYGRFSKSIRPAECVCGACKVGKLIPMFSVAQRAPRTPKTKADSRMAADKPHDSPQRIPDAISTPRTTATIAPSPTRSRGPAQGRIAYTVHDSDSSSDSRQRIPDAISTPGTTTTITASPTRIRGPAQGRIVYSVHDSDSDSDSDVEILTMVFRDVTIGADASDHVLESRQS